MTPLDLARSRWELAAYAELLAERAGDPVGLVTARVTASARWAEYLEALEASC